MEYDDASNVIETITMMRYHDAPASQTGELEDPSTTPKARETYMASYPDTIGRPVASANYGTNGGSSLSRSSTIPTRSDSILATSFTYDSAGNRNEITDITETAGSSWVTSAYNAAGNMTTIPQPADPTKSFTATYDAWNRLVKLVDGSNTVSEYEYDGAKRRTIQKSYTGGTLDETRHLYYTEPSRWQVIEERVDTDTDPNRQFIWGRRYIDDLVLRDRDTTGNGTLDERLYALQDANWNVTALSNTTGTIQERYAYTAYGQPTFLTSTFGSRTSSSYNWETLYAGYRWETGTELFHVRNRVLNSAIGTWVQRDRLGLSAGFNVYCYTAGRGITLTDPTGLIPYCGYYGVGCDPPPRPRPPPFPGPGQQGQAQRNRQTTFGFSCGLFECPAAIVTRVTPNPNPGPPPQSPPPGPNSGFNNSYGTSTSSAIGGGGAAGCAVVVMKCDDGFSVFHFTAGDDPSATIGPFWSPYSTDWSDCEAIVCGGDDGDRESRCLHADVHNALQAAGVQVIATLGSSACGFNPDGTIHEYD